MCTVESLTLTMLKMLMSVIFIAYSGIFIVPYNALQTEEGMKSSEGATLFLWVIVPLLFCMMAPQAPQEFLACYDELGMEAKIFFALVFVGSLAIAVLVYQHSLELLLRYRKVWMLQAVWKISLTMFVVTGILLAASGIHAFFHGVRTLSKRSAAS